jgi:hypothetical protein
MGFLATRAGNPVECNTRRKKGQRRIVEIISRMADHVMSAWGGTFMGGYTEGFSSIFTDIYV